MEVVGSVATIVQIASFAAEVLAIGYGYISKVKKAPLEIRTLMRELMSLNELLNQLEELATEDKIEGTKTALAVLETSGTFDDCKRMIKVVQKSVKACQQVEGEHFKNAGKRMFWPFKEKETKETILQLGTLRDTLSAAVNVDSAKTLSRLEELVQSLDHNGIRILEEIDFLQDGLTEIQVTTRDMADKLAFLQESHQAQIRESERKDILRWLRIDGIDSDAKYKEALFQRQGATGSWVLDTEQFLKWREQTAACLWLYGIAGCGKTVLAASIVSYFQQSVSEATNCAALYFFCDHRDPEKQNFRDLLCILVKQLLDDKDECFAEIQAWREEKKTVSSEVTKPLGGLDYVDLIRRLCARWDCVYLIIDAVDECADFTTFIKGVVSLLANCNIKLLLTSRHDVELVRAIEPIAKYSIPVAPNMRDDILSFLTSQLDKRIMNGTLKLRDKSLQGIITEELEKKADGMILIAKLHLDYICRLKSDRAIKEALHKLPSDIFSTYDKILQQICIQHPDELEEIERILQWLLYAMVPLTLEQVAEIVSVRPGDTSLDKSGIATDLLDLAASLGSLVTLKTQETVGSIYADLRGSQITLMVFAHASVEEYFKSGKMAPGLAECFCTDSEKIQQMIAKTCAQYIAFEDFNHFIEGVPQVTTSEVPQREYSRERVEYFRDSALYPRAPLTSCATESSITSDIPNDMQGNFLDDVSDSEDAIEEADTTEPHPSLEPSENTEFVKYRLFASRGRRLSLNRSVGSLSPPISLDRYSKSVPLSLDDERARLRQRTSEFAFYDYACRYWADHLAKSFFSKSLDSEAIQLLGWFLEPLEYIGNYISWQQMYHHDIVYYCPGRPSIHYAIEFQIESLIELLRPAKEQVNELICGVSALHVAARCGAYATAEALIKDGAVVDLRTAKDPTGMTSLMTPLHFAAECGHSNIIKLLLKHGASPHVTNESGATAFYRAARSGSLQALKILYDAGSDINIQKKGFTPLFEAVAQCRPKIACQLLQWGADPTIPARGGQSTLSLLQKVQNEPYLKQYWAAEEDGGDQILHTTTVTRWFKESEIFEQIEHIRALNAPGGSGFMVMLQGLKRTWVLLKQMIKDTRPGTEREKDVRLDSDKSMIVTVAEFLDKEEE